MGFKNSSAVSMTGVISITTFPLSDFTRATVFQPVAYPRVRVHKLSQLSGWARGSRSKNPFLRITDVQLAVPRRKITKKRGELIAATGTSITLYYTVEPSSLCDPPRGFPSIGDLSRLSLSTNVQVDGGPRADRERATEDR